MAWMLRVRPNDQAQWGPPTAYKSKRECHENECMCRIWGGLRTHTWRETKAEERKRIEEHGDDDD